MITVVTSFGNEGFDLYGRRFVDSFLRYWPVEVGLFVYHEGKAPLLSRDNCVAYDLRHDVADCAAFLERHKDNAEAHGRVPNSRWKAKAVHEGYYFRFDAYKFCRKVFAVRHAARMLGHGKLFWLDADVVTTRAVEKLHIDALLPNGYPVSYLGRRNTHSECGFIGYNLKFKEAHDVIEDLADLYAKDDVFALPETHDSFVFDWVRNRLGVHGLNLTPNGRGNVWALSPLARFSLHNKGDRKRTYGGTYER